MRLRPAPSSAADAAWCWRRTPATLRRWSSTGCTRLGDATWRERHRRRLRTAPPFPVWRLWLDRPVRADRAGFLGTSGYGPLDNVSVLERFEGGAAALGSARPAARWWSCTRTRCRPAPTSRGCRAQLLEGCARVYPETGGAAVDADEWLRRATTARWPAPDRRRGPRCAPRTRGGAGRRRRPLRLPVALMERAATTGFLAANALLRPGVRGQGCGRSR